MYFFLPTQRGGLPALLKQLSGEKLLSWIRKKTPFTQHKVPTHDGRTIYQVQYIVGVSIPKFTVESGNVDMVSALSSLGVRNLFSQSDAEIGGMTEGGGEDGKNGLFVNRVAHRAAMQVNELGTEASALGLMVGDIVVTVIMWKCKLKVGIVLSCLDAPLRALGGECEQGFRRRPPIPLCYRAKQAAHPLRGDPLRRGGEDRDGRRRF